MDKRFSSKTYKDAIEYLEFVSRLCEVNVDIRFRPEKINSNMKSNKWVVRVLGTNFMDTSLIVATKDALEFIINAYPKKFNNQTT